jgi:hypothetical protein
MLGSALCRTKRASSVGGSRLEARSYLMQDYRRIQHPGGAGAFSLQLSCKDLKTLGVLQAGCRRGREHALEDALHGHGVSASPITGEEVAGALPLVIRQTNAVAPVLSLELDLESLEADAPPFAGVATSLLDLADYA